MLLRRFYIQENDKGRFSIRSKVEFLTQCSHISPAPKPRPKKNRELNTAFDTVAEIVATTGGDILPSS